VSGVIELERVVRTNTRGKPSGKIHLTALVPDLGEVRTLCGQHFPAAAAMAVEEQADCQLCLRRRDNPALVSAALFEAGLGAKLLALSLEKVAERPERAKPAPARPRVVGPAASQQEKEPARAPRIEPREPDQVGELRLEGLTEIGEDLYRSPVGVLIRLRQGADGWYVNELVHEGPVLFRRRSQSRLMLRVGDVTVELESDGRVRAAYAVH
jgi:hypothetical protein